MTESEVRKLLRQMKEQDSQTQNFFGFSKSLCNGGLYLFLHIHLRHTETGTAQAGFDKTRQAYLCLLYTSRCV